MTDDWTLRCMKNDIKKIMYKQRCAGFITSEEHEELDNKLTNMLARYEIVFKVSQ